jgi:hypothetical protein
MVVKPKDVGLREEPEKQKSQNLEEKLDVAVNKGDYNHYNQ